MSADKKYNFEVSESDGLFTARITRKVNSKKRITTDEKSGFKSEEEAQAWGLSAMETLLEAQRQANEAQLKKRKENQEVKSQRSARRAAKTEQRKLEAADSKLNGVDSTTED